MPKEISIIKTAPNLTLKAPNLYNVIYINDEVTTVEFVIQSLVNIFNHDYQTAAAITEAVHETGSGVAATLPYEIAEQKGVEATQLARANNYPLVIKLEENK